MLKTTDIPVEQRPFFKVFDRVSYHYQYSEVFDDYLTMLINWFANGEQRTWRDDALKKYSDEERKMFTEMYRVHMQLFCDQINAGKKWYDTLGDFYQTITSSYKQAAMGQFFTPPDLCTMIAEMVVDKEKAYELIHEPASGSGRMILAAHAMNPMNYYHAIDVDNMCAKMTAINMCLHNCSGLVSHGDAISFQFFRHFSIDRVKVGAGYLPYLKVLDDQKANEYLHVMTEWCRIMKNKAA